MVLLTVKEWKQPTRDATSRLETPSQHVIQCSPSSAHIIIPILCPQSADADRDHGRRQASATNSPRPDITPPFVKTSTDTCSATKPHGQLSTFATHLSEPLWLSETHDGAKTSPTEAIGESSREELLAREIEASSHTGPRLSRLHHGVDKQAMYDQSVAAGSQTSMWFVKEYDISPDTNLKMATILRVALYNRPVWMNDMEVPDGKYHRAIAGDSVLRLVWFMDHFPCDRESKSRLLPPPHMVNFH